MTDLLSREVILGAEDIETTRVEVPEWGGAVLVRGMTGAQRDRYEQNMIATGEDGKQKVTLRDARARLCAYCIIDEDGKRVFSDADIRELTKKSAKALDRVYEAASSLSGINDKDLRELTENLDEGQNADSG